jgi:hypothetical protein
MTLFKRLVRVCVCESLSLFEALVLNHLNRHLFFVDVWKTLNISQTKGCQNSDTSNRMDYIAVTIGLVQASAAPR